MMILSSASFVVVRNLRARAEPLACFLPQTALLSASRGHPTIKFVAVEPNRPSRTRCPEISRLDRTPQCSPVDVAVSRGLRVVEVRTFCFRRLHAAHLSGLLAAAW